MAHRRTFWPALLGALAAAAGVGVPATALASSHQHAHHATTSSKKKKKKSKSKKTKVVVHCASTKVTCKGKTGAQGPAGATGAQGNTGAAGAPGANIVLQSNLVGATAAGHPMTCPVSEDELCGAVAAMNPGSWTQGANEDDSFIGSATVNLPTQTVCGLTGSDSPRGIVTVWVDGLLAGIAQAEATSAAASTTTVALAPAGILASELGGVGVAPGFWMSTGSPQSHSLQLQISDNCTSVSATGGATLTSARVDVLGTV
ncbi:MAG TPA: collagen-like protein [Solirubrobacteraceae bacterium]|jgi:hypothetical protein|nr:collagen-like protein [Solirubrobacteraceae bacterium]